MSDHGYLVGKLVECIDEVGRRFQSGGDSGFWRESDIIGLLFHLLQCDATMTSQPCGQRNVGVSLVHLEVPARVRPVGKRTEWYDLALFDSDSACRVGDEDMRHRGGVYCRRISENRSALAVVEALTCGPTVQERGKADEISDEIGKIQRNMLAGQVGWGCVAVFCWTLSAPGARLGPRTPRESAQFGQDVANLRMLLRQACPSRELGDRIHIFYASDNPNEPPPTWI